ncbi:MAG: carbamoyltransferase HypF [Magnetococcales bacterium]|nr:carbamoyltransferase HypF [Magnetococcales bacterium]
MVTGDGLLRIPLSGPALRRRVLALGVETRNRPAAAADTTITLWEPQGDLGDPALRQDWTRRLEAGRTALDPERLVVDLHPDMVPTLLGRARAAAWGLPVQAVQHHHAHAAAVMAEQGLEACLALVFDGFGWGPDGRLWGAELLHLQGVACRRLGSFAPVPLPGGDAAVRQPLRQLVARLDDAGVELDAALRRRWGLDEPAVRVWRHQCHTGLNSPLTHGAGRLFDAMAALLGLAPATVSQSGAAAVALEQAALRARGEPRFPDPPFALREADGLLLVDWRESFRRLAGQNILPDDRPRWALGFHRAVARAAAALAEHGADQVPERDLVLSGGVFLNRLLGPLLAEALSPRGWRIRQAQRVPTGDAGIAVGQAWIGGGRA